MYHMRKAVYMAVFRNHNKDAGAIIRLITDLAIAAAILLILILPCFSESFEAGQNPPAASQRETVDVGPTQSPPAETGFRVSRIPDTTVDIEKATMNRELPRASLDEPFCEIFPAGPDTAFVTWDEPQPGDAVTLWILPETCTECVTVYPFHLDSIRIGVLLRDGASIDTLFLKAGLAQSMIPDSCTEPVCTVYSHEFAAALPADNPDGVDQVVWLTVPIDYSLLYPAFAVITLAGHSNLGNIQPAIAIDSTISAPVTECEAWLKRDDVWQNWSDYWTGDEPGYPLISVFGECSSLIMPDTLTCSSAEEIICEGDPIVYTGLSNESGSSTVDWYCCNDWHESGPEILFQISVMESSFLKAKLSNVSGGDVDLFLLGSCNPLDCLEAGDDSLTSDLPLIGDYWLVIDGFEGGTATFDLELELTQVCSNTLCLEDLNPGGQAGNRFLDGEYDESLGMVYYSFYPGSGSTQYILTWDPVTCEAGSSIPWTAADNGPCRMLAVDPRNGGTFWAGTVTDFYAGNGHLYRINSGGTVLNDWTFISGLPEFRWSGGAFDPVNHHLWVFIRTPDNSGTDTAYELDVSNPILPIVIQGPHLVPYSSPFIVLSSGGADYAERSQRILLGGQGVESDFAECLRDLDPAYSGPPPGPGLESISFCVPDSNTVQGYGLAAVDTGGNGTGTFFMTDFTADGPHPVWEYPSPCSLHEPQCDPVTDLTIVRNGFEENIILHWTAPQTGTYLIYSTTERQNPGEPPSAFWILEEELSVSYGPASWIYTMDAEEFRAFAVISQYP